jgi:hypothetical protein
MNMGGVINLWPHWCRTIEGAIRHGAVLRAVCGQCGTIFDLDLHAIERRRGPQFSLIDEHTQCRISKCRGRAYFLAASGMFQPYVLLMTAGDPADLPVGMRPIDLEPLPDPPPAAAKAA